MPNNQDKTPVDMNRDAYDTIADLFSQTRGYIEQDLAILKKHASSGDKILDVGCGDGRLIELFDGLDVEYTGVDISKSFIDLAKEMQPNGTFHVADMGETLPFEDNTFDKLYTIATVNHAPPSIQQHVFNEFHRVLKPGGTLVMRNWNMYNEWVQEKVAAGKYTVEHEKEYTVPWRNGPGDILATRYYYAFTIEELETLMTKADFTVETQYYTKKGGKVEVTTGENIISIAHK